MRNLLLLSSMFCVSIASAVDWTYEYNAQAEGVFITGRVKTSPVNCDLDIPQSIGGFPVVAIEDGAFANDKDIMSIKFPQGLKSIGGGAFYNCTLLSYVSIPASVTTIGSGAFSLCDKVRYAVIPSTFSFRHVFPDAQPYSILVPDGIKKVSNFAYADCIYLQDLSLPDSIEIIEGEAFRGARLLFDFTLPKNLKEIGRSAFKGFDTLRSLAIPSSVVSIGPQAFSGCGSLTSLVIPDSVTSIGANAFSFCSNMVSITLPKYIKVIPGGAFLDCKKLSTLRIPDCVVDIGDGAFANCTALKNLSLSASVTSIGQNAFGGCIELTRLEFPRSLYYIHAKTFTGCAIGTVLRFTDAPPTITGSTLIDLENVCEIQYPSFREQEWISWLQAAGAESKGKVYIAESGNEPLDQGWKMTAKQRYPWNGLVDIAVTYTGKQVDFSQYECRFSATNAETQVGLTVASVARKGEDIVDGMSRTRKFVWDAQQDIGAVKVEEVALYVEITPKPLEGVQLWEDGPFWAERNIGADKPEEYGYYFWWGDTVGYKVKSGTLSGSEYKDVKWESSSGVVTDSSPFTSENCPTYIIPRELYNSGYITTEPYTLTRANDAAIAHLGTPWRMPTEDEIARLTNKCRTYWTKRNGVCGRLVMGKDDYSTRNIFLPAGGFCKDSTIVSIGSYGLYWSASLRSFADIGCWELHLDSTYFYDGVCSPERGLNIRAVRDFVDTSKMKSYVVSEKVFIDCREGVRSANSTETISYSTDWMDDVPPGVKVVVLVGDVVLTNANGSGNVEWTPIRNGEYVLTHKLMNGESQIGETYTSTFSVTGKILTFPAGSIAVNSYGGIYDGAPHSVAITVTGVDDAQVRYSLSQEGPYSSSRLEFVDVCNVAVWYEVSATGYATVKDRALVSIACRPVTLASQANCWPYDGEWHSDPIANCVSGMDFVHGETISTNFTSGIKEVGRIPNAFNIAWNGSAKASNYDVTLITNDLKVVSAGPVQVAISAETMTKIYSGEEYRNDGFTFTATNPSFGWDDITFIGTSNLASVAVCNLTMNLKASDFSLRGNHFESANFIIAQDGSLVVEKAAVDSTIIDSVNADSSDNSEPFSQYDSCVRYDGQGHTIDTNALYAVTIPAASPTISFAKDVAGFGLSELPHDIEWVSTPPAYTNCGEYVVWYRILDANYEEYVHKVKVKVLPQLQVRKVVASQRYPWEGVVDIVVTIEGVREEVQGIECAFVATNMDSSAEILMQHISRKGKDVVRGDVCERKYIWDAKKDIGLIAINEVMISVKAKLPGVQLWENGPYFAECNVGATKPEEYGYYFWWGDTVGYQFDGSRWNAFDGSAVGFRFNKYYIPNRCITYQGKGNLTGAYDAATAHLGSLWRLPTEAECQGLVENCVASWTTRDSVVGCLVQGKGDYASVSIFLPAAGYGEDRGNYWVGSAGYYLTSTPNYYYGQMDYDWKTISSNWRLCVSSSGISCVGYQAWFYANSARGVRDKVDVSVVKASSQSTTLRLDCRDGVRTIGAAEVIAYSTEWMDDAPSNATAVVIVGDQILTNSAGSGFVEWVPKYDGGYTLTHTVMTNGIAIGRVLTAAYRVEGVASIVPFVEDDADAMVTGDATTGFVVKPSAGKTVVEVSIPTGVEPNKVMVEVPSTVETITPNGATIRIVNGTSDITSYLDIPEALNGVVDLSAAEVKEAIVKEAMDPAAGAQIEINADNPLLTTSATKPGLVYTLREGTSLESMVPGASKVGDGQPWTPNVTVKGGSSGFYSISVGK